MVGSGCVRHTGPVSQCRDRGQVVPGAVEGITRLYSGTTQACPLIAAYSYVCTGLTIHVLVLMDSRPPAPLPEDVVATPLGKRRLSFLMCCRVPRDSAVLLHDWRTAHQCALA